MNMSNLNLHDIKRQYFLTGELPADLASELPFVQAWIRSKQYGLSPESRITGLNHFKSTSLSHEDSVLANLAQPVLEEIGELFAQQDVSVYITNVEHTVIAEQHSKTDKSQHFLKIGQIISPENFGALAPNSCIQSKKPVMMHGSQHYLSHFSNYSCMSVPLFDGQHQVVGALNLTTQHHVLASHWLRHLLYQSAVLENKLILQQRESQHRVLYFQYSKDLLDTAYTGLIQVDAQGRMVKANQMALQLLNVEISELSAKPLVQIFDYKSEVKTDSTALSLILNRENVFFYARFEPQLILDSDQGDVQDNALLNNAIKILKADIPILITGETGSGKEHFTQALHRALGEKCPLISINCGAIPENLIEAELFGHESGAFTGARTRGQKGLIELADQGILFLDEIGDLPMHLQVKILRVLQDQKFYRVGGREPIASSFKLVCATNQDLKELINIKQFRSDLYYRIRGYEIEMPALRRRQDKVEVMRKILATMQINTWHPYVEQQLEQYSWPGNIRELIHVLKLSVALSRSDSQPCSSLNELILPSFQSSSTLHLDSTVDLEQSTRRLILQALAQENGNVTRTAKRLNISRTTIYKYLKPS